MTINKLTLASALTGILMTSCNSFNPEKVAKEWDVTTIGKQQVAPGPNAPYIGFDKGLIYGYTGCNRINGGIEIDGDKFSAQNVSTTMRFCPNAKYEQDFLKALSEGQQIKVTENGFNLLDAQGNQLVSFTPRALEVKDLEGKWFLSNMNGDTIARDERTPFLIFDIQEKRLSGFTGCNRLNENLDLEALEDCNADFTQMAMTRKFCDNNVFEADFVEALNISKNIRIVDDLLYIYSEDDDNYLIFTKE